MKFRLFSALAAVAAISMIVQSARAGGAVATSYASHGGRADSTAVAHGNANVGAHASAVAGYASARMEGRGFYGGRADGNAVATTVGGVAISEGVSDARGWGARSVSNTVASSYHGFARSQSGAISRGAGLSVSNSTALSRFGHADSASKSIAMGRFGGQAIATSESLADSVHAPAISRARAIGQASWHGQARADSVGVSVGRYRPTYSWADSRSHATHGGFSNARAAHINTGP